MNISARNQLVGKVAKIISGAVNAEISVALPGGGEIVAVIKASDILLAVPCGNPDCKCGK